MWAKQKVLRNSAAVEERALVRVEVPASEDNAIAQIPQRIPNPSVAPPSRHGKIFGDATTGWFSDTSLG